MRSVGLGTFPSIIVLLVSCLDGVLVVVPAQNAVLRRWGLASAFKNFCPFYGMGSVQSPRVESLDCDAAHLAVCRALKCAYSLRRIVGSFLIPISLELSEGPDQLMLHVATAH